MHLRIAHKLYLIWFLVTWCHNMYIHMCQRQVTGTSLWWKLENISFEGYLVLSWLESLANLPICLKFVLNDDDETCPKSPWHTDFVVVVCRSADFILLSCGHKKTILVEMFLLLFWPFLKKKHTQQTAGRAHRFPLVWPVIEPAKNVAAPLEDRVFWGTGDWCRPTFEEKMSKVYPSSGSSNRIVAFGRQPFSTVFMIMGERVCVFLLHF